MPPFRSQPKILPLFKSQLSIGTVQVPGTCARVRPGAGMHSSGPSKYWHRSVPVKPGTVRILDKLILLSSQSSIGTVRIIEKLVLLSSQSSIGIVRILDKLVLLSSQAGRYRHQLLKKKTSNRNLIFIVTI
jgi:hypothetical protein